MCLLARDSPAAIPDKLLISVNTLWVCMLRDVPANTQGTKFPLTWVLSFARGEHVHQYHFEKHLKYSFGTVNH